MGEVESILKKGPYPTLVAVVTTIHKGIVNAAPITWFTPCSYDPPLMMICVKRGSDTLENIIDNHQFILQTVPYEYAFSIHKMAKKLPRERSELYCTPSIEIITSDIVSVPRLSIANQWYECISGRRDKSTVGKTHVQIIGRIVNDHAGSFSETDKHLLYCGGLTYTCNGEDIVEVDPY